jgi:hypothetical protein
MGRLGVGRERYTGDVSTEFVKQQSQPGTLKARVASDKYALSFIHIYKQIFCFTGRFSHCKPRNNKN